MKEKKFLNKILYYIIALSGIFLSGSASAQITGKMLDGVLSGMDSGFSFDAMIASMERRPEKKVDTGLLSSVADAMTFDGALDYLDGIYSSDEEETQERRGYSVYRPMIAGTAVLPVSGAITSRFGYRPQFGRMHKGVDIALQVGDTVCAALDGTVARVSVDPKGYGHFIVIKHDDGLETRYAHLSRSLVLPGMRVMAGEPVALGGNTGNSTGPHLHFEVRQNGLAYDPTTMFDFSMPGGMTRHRTLADLDRINPGVVKTGKSSGSESWRFNPAGVAGERTTYVVKTGDTVASVAKANGISVLTLCRLNMISAAEQLQPGRMLKIR